MLRVVLNSPINRYQYLIYYYLMDLHSELGDLLNVPSWYKQANCRGEDQDLFFPERGSSTIKAKAICGACPVQTKCLDFAVGRKERFGIWGGKSVREMRAIRRQERLKKKKS